MVLKMDFRGKEIGTFCKSLREMKRGISGRVRKERRDTFIWQDLGEYEIKQAKEKMH